MVEFRPQDIFATLDRHGVRYVLVGGMAAVYAAGLDGLRNRIEPEHFIHGEDAYARTDLGGPGPAPQAIGCDLTGGSSGGPWIMKFSGGAGATNYVNGDNSHRRSTNPLEMFSPHYDDQAKTLRDCLVIGC